MSQEAVDPTYGGDPEAEVPGPTSPGCLSTLSCGCNGGTGWLGYTHPSPTTAQWVLSPSTVRRHMLGKWSLPDPYTWLKVH